MFQEGITDFVKTLSKLSIKSTGIGAYGSTIKSYSVTAAGTTYSGSSVTTNTLAVSGNVTVTVKVTDSRGRTGSLSKTINVKDYARPKISAFSVRRCNFDGTANDAGSYCRVNIDASVANIVGNTLNLDVEVIESGQTSGAIYNISSEGFSFKDSKIIPSIEIDKTYVFNVYAMDVFYDSYEKSSNKTIPISSARTIMHVKHNEKGLGVGKYCESDAFECGFPAKFFDDAYIQTEFGTFAKVPIFVCGEIVITPDEANKPTSVIVKFPENFFSEPPIVTVTPVTSVPGTNVTGIGVGFSTKDDVEIFLTRTNTSPTHVYWQAIQI